MVYAMFHHIKTSNAYIQLSAYNYLTCMFTLIVYKLKSIRNRITCVCHLIIKDYLLTYLDPDTEDDFA